MGETSCVSCGQCIAVCPTGALQEKSQVDGFWRHRRPQKHVIGRPLRQYAPLWARNLVIRSAPMYRARWRPFAASALTKYSTPTSVPT
ncbi:MAG: 4Fe-4S binding protein [Anaeromassilibacillus sp.]